MFCAPDLPKGTETALVVRDETPQVLEVVNGIDGAIASVLLNSAQVEALVKIVAPHIFEAYQIAEQRKARNAARAKKPGKLAVAKK